MSKFKKEFDKRFTNEWFSSEWTDVETQKEPKPALGRKDLKTLKAELAKLNESIEEISQKQLRLKNLAMFYNT